MDTECVILRGLAVGGGWATGILESVRGKGRGYGGGEGGAGSHVG